MTDSLSHRGPDGRGVYRAEFSSGKGVALGHRRLAIIDPDGGQQPMRSTSGRLYVTFNGEIYNYVELRTTLKERGHLFRTNSDTECILHAYEAFGEDFVDHLRGMFAIAIWDSNAEKLILARDRMGEKPLVYCKQRDRLIFGSEIKALLTLESVGKELRPESIDQYLRYGYIPHPWTAYAGIEKLPPGHLGVYENGTLRIKRYWTPYLKPQSTISMNDACERLQHIAEESVRLRMRSDVPIGAFLSGGIDSTIIAGLMQEQSPSQIQTFNLGFTMDDPQEQDFARQTAQRLGADYRSFTLQPAAIASLDKLVKLFDEPFADCSAVATYFLSQLTRPHRSVVMTGDGGDELFSGYARYKTLDRLAWFDKMPDLFKRMLTGPWVDLLPNAHPETNIEKLKHRLKILRDGKDSRYRHWLTSFSRYQREQLYTPEYLASFDADESDSFLITLMQQFASERPAVQAMRVDMHSYLPCDILAKVDITSMAEGMECRSPFMDHKLIEAVSEFPQNVIHQSGRNKPLLCQAFRRFIPPTASRRSKVGFTLPQAFWRHPSFLAMANDSLRSADAFVLTYVRRDAIENMLQQHMSGYMNHGERLWSLLFLERWGRNTASPNTSVQAMTQNIDVSIPNALT